MTAGDAPPTITTFQFPGPCKSGLFLQSDCLQVLGFRNNLPHVFTGGRPRLTGEINDMSEFIPGGERYFRRSLHMKNCSVRLLEHVR